MLYQQFYIVCSYVCTFAYTDANYVINIVCMYLQTYIYIHIDCKPTKKVLDKHIHKYILVHDSFYIARHQLPYTSILPLHPSICLPCIVYIFYTQYSVSHNVDIWIYVHIYVVMGACVSTTS